MKNLIISLYNKYKDIFLYLIVGVIATLTEWLFFWIFDGKLGMHYSLATGLAFIFSTFANWAAGRLIMFKKVSMSIVKELLSIYAVGVIGFLMNLLIMWIAIDKIGIHDFISKMIATGIVFFWNYFIRKLFIYRKPKYEAEDGLNSID